MSKAVVIGAGASGMLAAILLSENGIETTVLDRMDIACKKIYATGNGKCNFTNLHLSNECYHGGITNIMNVLSRFDNMSVMDFFLESGVPSYEINGYIYPHSRQASSIAKALCNRLKCAGGKLMLNCNCKKIEVCDDGSFSITYEENTDEIIIKNIDENKGKKIKNSKKTFERKVISADYIINAAGGKSQRKLGSDGSGTYFARQTGHNIVEEIPALCKIFVKENIKDISGVRIVGRVNGIKGEIIFGDSHISGIPVFQLSSLVGRQLKEGKRHNIIVETVSDMNDFILKKAIENNIKNQHQNIYSGIIPDKLGIYIMKNKNIDRYSSVYDAIDALSFELCPECLAEFEESQVTSGGVAIDDIDINSMESKIVNNMYFCGEVMDVDGICGGYNLQWAFTSGAIAAKSIVDKEMCNTYKEMENKENDTN